MKRKTCVWLRFKPAIRIGSSHRIQFTTQEPYNCIWYDIVVWLFSVRSCSARRTLSTWFQLNNLNIVCLILHVSFSTFRRQFYTELHTTIINIQIEFHHQWIGRKWWRSRQWNDSLHKHLKLDCSYTHTVNAWKCSARHLIMNFQLERQ